MRLPTSFSTTVRVNLGMLAIVGALVVAAPQPPAQGAEHKPAASPPAAACLRSPDAYPVALAGQKDSAAARVACP